MKNIMIIGTGNQGKKYYNFFKNFFGNTYKITLVNKSGLDKNNFFKKNIIKYSNIKNNVSFIKKFNLIVIAVHEEAQTNIIYNLLNKNITDIKIIIEKPISFDLKLINILVNKENFFFFIDETYSNNINNNILKDIDKYNLQLKLPKQIDIIQHALGLFLKEENFKYIINKCYFNYTKNIENYIYYKIEDYKKNQIINYKGNFFIHTKFHKYLYNLDFYRSINNLLYLNQKNNKIIKKNLLEMNNFLLNRVNLLN